jgi:DNA-binding transcriptional LysR family regulator
MAAVALEYLITFAKVAERTSITLAARDLGLSKATVSKQISELEARLGVILFARTTRSLMLTEAGHKAILRTKRIMDEADLMAEDAQDSRLTPAGRITIAAPQTFSRLWLADALPDFMIKFPQISLELSTDDRIVDLISGGFDAALRISSMPDSSLVARRVAPIKLCLVAAPRYWAKHGQPSHPDELSRHACMRYSNTPDRSYWRFSGPDGQEARVKIDGPLTVNGGDIEMPALRAGLGIALLPDFAICRDVRAGHLEVAKLPWHAPDLTLHLLTPPGRSKPKRLEVFTDFLVSSFGGRVPPWGLN